MTVPRVSESDSPKATVMPGGGIFGGLHINPLGQLGPLQSSEDEMNYEVFHPLR